MQLGLEVHPQPLGPCRRAYSLLYLLSRLWDYPHQVVVTDHDLMVVLLSAIVEPVLPLLAYQVFFELVSRLLKDKALQELFGQPFMGLAPHGVFVCQSIDDVCYGLLSIFKPVF